MQLKIVAANESGSSVTLAGIMVKIPIGLKAYQLTNSVFTPVPPTGWQNSQIRRPNGFIEYYFLPLIGFGTLKDGDSLNFIFDDIEVNSQTGEVEIDVMEGSGDCSPKMDCPVANLSITKFPNSYEDIVFKVDPVDVPYGGSTVLTWRGPSGATYSIEYSSPSGTVHIPPPPISNEGRYPADKAPPLTLTETTFFTLFVKDNIAGSPYETQIQRTVHVGPAPPPPPPVIEKFSGFLRQGNTGLEVVLNWKTDAEVCLISGDAHKLEAVSMDNEYVVYPSLHPPLRQYTLTATNKGGDTKASLTPAWSVSKSVQIIGAGPVAVSPDSSRVFAAMTTWGFIVELNGASLQQIGSSVKVGSGPAAITVSPDGTRIYVTDYSELSVTTLDARTSPPTPIGNSVTAGAAPGPTVITPDGKYLFVSNIDDGTVTVIATSQDAANPLSVVATISLGVSGPNSGGGLAISSDGSKLFACAGGSSNTIVVIDAATFAVVGRSGQLDDVPNDVAVVTRQGETHVFVAVGDLVSWLSVFKLSNDPNSPLVFRGNYQLSYQNYSGMAFSADGSCLLLVTRDFGQELKGKITTVDIDTLTATGPSVYVGSLPFTPAVSGDGLRIFVTAWKDDKLSLLTPASLVGGIGN